MLKQHKSCCNVFICLTLSLHWRFNIQNAKELRESRCSWSVLTVLFSVTARCSIFASRWLHADCAPHCHSSPPPRELTGGICSVRARARASKEFLFLFSPFFFAVYKINTSLPSYNYSPLNMFDMLLINLLVILNIYLYTIKWTVELTAKYCKIAT